MHHFLKRLLVALALVGATTPSSFSADTIRLSGPNGELLDAPQYSEPVRPAVVQLNEQPSRYYGPTAKSETLWSIASKFKPAGATVQQTIYAFYELNPGVFEDKNIHKLMPGNRLRVPSPVQINQVDRQEALSVLAAHQQRLNSAVTAKPQVAKPEVTKPEVTKPEVAKPVKVTPSSTPPQVTKPEKKELKPVSEASPSTSESIIDSKEADKPASTGTVEANLTSTLQKELTRSEGELVSLEARNHQLRLMLSEVQQQVDTLKDEVNNEGRIRSEVERQLLEEKRKQDEMQRLAPTTMDTWLANPWIVGLLAILPAALVGLLVMLFMRTRKRKDPEEEAQAQSTNDTSNIAIAGAGAAVAESQDDDLFSDELFGDFESNNDVDNTAPESSDPVEDDIFGDLNEGELDFNLDDEEDPFASIGDDGELDIGFVDLDSSNNGISVKDGEKALGLEEMERALNDVAVPADDLEDLNLNLDEDDADPVSQQELDDLFADISFEEPSLDEPLEKEGAINQAEMDELLSEAFDLEASEEDVPDTENLSRSEEQAASPELSDNADDIAVDNADIDDLFAQFSQMDMPSEASAESGDADTFDTNTFDANNID
ncbi:FimV/HubP family polar landmark protein, partial [Vibrio sp. 10N.261.51.F12]|uniref:FimV/HubP family polar landmark protein n=1 Tax=Vibrio sp. 10N.261.51.F12 TaxID=3229679 RepID=UPI00354DC2B8